LTFYSVTVLNTNLGLFVFGLVLLLGLWLLSAPASSKHRALQFIALGVLLGLLVNLRANAVILIVLVVPLALVVRRHGGATLQQTMRLLGCFALAYGLTAAACGSVRGPQLGFNLYIGNNPDNPTPYFRPVRFTSSAPESQAKGFTVEASRRAGHKLSPAGAERFWIESVLHDAVERPGGFLVHLAHKGLAVVHASPSDNNHDLRMFDDSLAALRWLLPSWLLLALGVTSMTLLPFDRRKLAGCAVFALYAATLLAFFGGERLRAPLLLVAAPYAAGGLLELARAAGALRKRMLWRAFWSAAIVAALAHLPLEGADELSGAYNIRALMLLDAGDLDGAERWYRRSLALDELDSPGARIGLAAILEKRGQHADAVEMLQALPDSHYEAASKYEWLGNLALGAGRAQDALHAYEAALEIDSSRQNAYKGLYIAHRLLGETSEASAADERLRYVQSFQ
jgi:hypothetical protein